MVAQEHFYADSLEDFVAGLRESGFGPVDGSDSQRWRGPIHPEFRDLTDAESMDIVICSWMAVSATCALRTGTQYQPLHIGWIRLSVAGWRLQPGMDDGRWSVFEN